MMEKSLREDRLALWDRLIRGEAVERAEVERVVATLIPDASHEERVSCILLLAAARIACEGSRAMRRKLTAALRYWFSHTGSKNRPSDLDICKARERSKWRNAGLLDFMGLYISWPEAMCSVGGNPKYYTALTELKNNLKRKYIEEWERVFGSQAPSNFTHGR